ncbi:hypothetical protein [Sediminibacterium sp.]|uniref:hypothetical protein n=1 Tax=Sediminibacterium sp. TaxID=1917865 RepID=UPI0026011E4B|nr:hypothetical protein [Sediminibacterium sp.]MBW0177582.1 hypothetical protein [Sediminibacterium sp.]
MKFLFFAGLIFFVGSIFLIPSTYEKLKVEKNGSIVKMRIEQLPKTCIGARVNYNVIYSYEGVFYNKSTRGNFCQLHSVGEMIDMKYLNGSEIVLRPNESAMISFISLAVLGFGGLLISILQWKKSRSVKR